MIGIYHTTLVVDKEDKKEADGEADRKLRKSRREAERR
jgi:hypothetical protein